MAEPVTSETSGGSVFGRLSSYAAKGLRYWEVRRPFYNAVLALVLVTQFALGLPGSREKLSFDLCLTIFLLAVLANVAYCAVYVADLFVQFSGLEGAWRRGRVAIWLVGTAFAATITHFFAKGFFGG
jgi:hypothetical protein